MGKQSTLFNFFSKGDSSSPTNNSKPRPKFKVGFERVLKKVVDAKVVDDTYVPPVFVTGFVKEFHGDSENTNNSTYTIKFENDNGNYGQSPASASSVTSSTPSTTPSTETWKESDVEFGVRLYKSIGTKIAKHFDDGIYNGHVSDVNQDDDDAKVSLYRIKYDDGDSEDLTDNELQDCKKLYLSEQKKKKTTKRSTTSSKKPTKTTSKLTTTKRPVSAAVKSSNDDGETDGKRKRTRVSYKEDNSDDADDDDDDEEFDDAAAAAAEDDDDDDVSMDDTLDDDDMSVESEKKPAPKKKAPAAKKKTATKKTEGNSGKKPVTPEEIIEDYYERVEKAKKSYKPNDNPQKWPESGDFVDPVGMDPTNGIIEGIIAAQVQKVAGLLQLVKSCKNGEELNTAGQLCFPIKIQTACSGTDAPSIALELIQESFDRMCTENKFDYEHLMSCEIEPFKQSYIHR
jgi:hypothetical protein